MWNRIKNNTSIDYKKFWFTWLTNEVFNLFKFENIPPDMRTSFLLSFCLCGRSVFFKYNGEVVALDFAPGGKIGVYPVAYSLLVTNPVIHEKVELKPWEDCVPCYMFETDAILYFPYWGGGLYPLIERTAEQLAENDLTISQMQFVKRLPTVFTARTDTEFQGIQLLLKRIARGAREIVSRSNLNDSIKRLDSGSSNTAPLSEFTEYQQYVIGNFFNQIGVNATWNLKRERVQSAETNQNDETTKYNMKCVIERLQENFQKVNEMFGTDYRVSLNVEEIREQQKNVSRETLFETIEDNTEDGE